MGTLNAAPDIDQRLNPTHALSHVQTCQHTVTQVLLMRSPVTTETRHPDNNFVAKQLSVCTHLA